MKLRVRLDLPHGGVTTPENLRRKGRLEGVVGDSLKMGPAPEKDILRW